MEADKDILDKLEKEQAKKDYDKHYKRWKILYERAHVLALLLRESEKERDSEGNKMEKAARKAGMVQVIA